jgi:glycosyltransferase involved in cell wall biosynthesis
VVANLGPRLAKHFDLTYFSYTQMVGLPPIDFKGNPIISSPFNYPFPPRHFVYEVFKNLKPDAVLQIFDIFTCFPMFSEYVKELPLISYSPVDAIPLPEKIKKPTEFAKVVVPMCWWSKEVYEAGGIKCTEPIYHGADTEIYHPRDKAEMKAKFGFDPETFLVLMVQDNRRRKNIPNQIQAFLDFKKQTGARAHLIGVIPDWQEHREWSMPVLWDNLKQYNNADDCFTRMDGLAESEVAELYCAADVLLQCTHSEGFGLPIIEAGACGTPSICTNFGSMAELIDVGRGWLVDGEMDYWQPDGLGGWQMSPRRNDIKDALLSAYSHPDNTKFYGEAMREWVLENCNWDKLAKKFIKVVDGDGR